MSRTALTFVLLFMEGKRIEAAKLPADFCHFLFLFTGNHLLHGQFERVVILVFLDYG
jgi:hypothetical protein